MPHRVAVPVSRFGRWVENFGAGHGTTVLSVVDGRLCGVAEDTSTFAAAAPFGRAHAGPADVAAFLAGVAPPSCWGVLLVRKGGFAVARLEAAEVVESKVGQRHVQGRTRAGGQSQQRFSRRRDNQARQAYEAAAGHAARIFDGHPVEALVAGGDHAAVATVLDEPRLRPLAERVVDPWLPVPDPRRAVLVRAVADAASISVEVVNTT